jgi:hypothetical protein
LSGASLEIEALNAGGGREFTLGAERASYPELLLFTIKKTLNNNS